MTWNQKEKVILIVEDDHKSLKLIRDLLTLSEYTILEATNGKQAVKISRKERPDLILMDIQMSVMDGLEATRILKTNEKTKNIPVIALTAYAMEKDEKRIREAGCDDYITKPINISELLKTMEAYFCDN